MFYFLLRTFLFQFEPEISHHLALKTLKWLHQCKLLHFRLQRKPVTIMGINFANPVGLAAGLDKDGEYIDVLAALGFGFIEIGTLTPKPQTGNPKPRLFRLKRAKALINRMGFNSKGLDYAIKNIQRAKYQGVLGINLGKNFTTPLEEASNDYLLGLQAVYPYASYVTINISSPNTPDLRQLQYGNYLDQLLALLKQAQQKLTEQYNKYVPLVIKISPDLTQAEVKEIASYLLKHKIDGVCATNTTIARDHVTPFKQANEAGGLSGAPLFSKSVGVVSALHYYLEGKIPIIAVGGISSFVEANAMFSAGASLVQLYTGFIYQGPNLIKKIIEKKL